MHDPDGKYEGANFLIASNDDIYQEKMREAEAIEARLRAEAEARAEVERLRLEEEAKLLIYVAHDYTARPWVPQGGSEEEIAAFAVRKNRPLLVHRIARRRRDFGITVEYADHEAVDKTVDLRKQIVNNYDTRRVELDVGLQVLSSSLGFDRILNATVCLYLLSCIADLVLSRSLAHLPVYTPLPLTHLVRRPCHCASTRARSARGGGRSTRRRSPNRSACPRPPRTKSCIRTR